MKINVHMVACVCCVVWYKATLYVKNNTEKGCIMKGFIKKIWGKINVCSVINAVALFLAIDTVNSACMWIMYQPEIPEEMKKYKKK